MGQALSPATEAAPTTSTLESEARALELTKREDAVKKREERVSKREKELGERSSPREKRSWSDIEQRGHGRGILWKGTC